ncbi:MAG: T9SS type A sorting domain-containing protein [Bacteroidia bacterium]|nr:T9SS type A sorting domain-containing protein [Bacteroidia bacterium]
MRRNIYLITIFTMFVLTNKAQTVFWTENFGTNPVCANVLASAYTSTNGAWTTSLTGTNQTFPNIWYVSATEAGMGVGNCGSGCSTNPILINRTLHISTNVGDLGAAYLAGAGFNSDIRAQSPTINCSGKSGIVLNFNYIMWGVINQDYCQIMYSADNGVTWLNLGIPPQTPTVSCTGQGLWTAHTVALPVSANNNSTVKVGFRWQNINATGADPSVAVDDVVLTYTAAVAPSLTPTFSLQTTICRGDSTQVTANTGTNVASGYTWSAVPAGPIFSAPNASVTYIKFNTATNYTITLTATSGTMTGSTSHSITVNPTPTVSAFSSTNVICNGNSAVLTGSGAINYTWTPGNMTVSPVTVSPTVTTMYQIVGTNSFGCKGYGSINITVIPKPTIGISSTTMNVCIGSSATITATGASTYSWAPNSSSLAILVVSPSVNTTYTVVGTSSAGCTNTNTITITTSSCSGGGTGLNSYINNELLYSVFPNPVKDKMIIKVGDANMSNVKVELFDVVGKKLFEQNLNSLAAGTEQSIQVSSLPKGVFILQMNVDGKAQKAMRLVKE